MVYLYSTIKMIHVPINIRSTCMLYSVFLFGVYNSIVLLPMFPIPIPLSREGQCPLPYKFMNKVMKLPLRILSRWNYKNKNIYSLIKICYWKGWTDWENGRKRTPEGIMQEWKNNKTKECFMFSGQQYQNIFVFMFSIKIYISRHLMLVCYCVSRGDCRFIEGWFTSSASMSIGLGLQYRP